MSITHLTPLRRPSITHHGPHLCCLKQHTDQIYSSFCKDKDFVSQYIISYQKIFQSLLLFEYWTILYVFFLIWQKSVPLFKIFSTLFFLLYPGGQVSISAPILSLFIPFLFIPLYEADGGIGMAFVCQSVLHSIHNTFVSAPYLLNNLNNFP